MSWKRITEDNLVAALSRREIEAFKSDFEVDAVERLIADTTAEVRGFIAAGRKCRIDPNAATLPPMLVSATADIVSFRLLKRLNIVPNEARTKAYERANELLEKIAAGLIVPEDYNESESNPEREVASAPAFSDPKPARLLD